MTHAALPPSARERGGLDSLVWQPSLFRVRSCDADQGFLWTTHRLCHTALAHATTTVMNLVVRFSRNTARAQDDRAPHPLHWRSGLSLSLSAARH